MINVVEIPISNLDLSMSLVDRAGRVGSGWVTISRQAGQSGRKY